MGIRRTNGTCSDEPLTVDTRSLLTEAPAPKRKRNNLVRSSSPSSPSSPDRDEPESARGEELPEENLLYKRNYIRVKFDTNSGNFAGGATTKIPRLDARCAGRTRPMARISDRTRLVRGTLTGPKSPWPCSPSLGFWPAPCRPVPDPAQASVLRHICLGVDRSGFQERHPFGEGTDDCVSRRKDAARLRPDRPSPAVPCRLPTTTEALGTAGVGINPINAHAARKVDQPAARKVDHLRAVHSTLSDLNYR